jgi:DNA-directed RNA polymerase subunit beta'
MFRTLEHNEGRKEFNPCSSWWIPARAATSQQVKQLAGMRGLMAKPSGEIIERPIVSNFREGLTVLEYFISTHGARKGLADTALKTADSGYLTRKLVTPRRTSSSTRRIAAPPTASGQAIYEGDDEIVKLTERIIGRVSCEDIKDPVTARPIVKRGGNHRRNQGAHASRRSARAGEDPLGAHLRIQARRLRRSATATLATGLLVKLGEAVGIIAAQSIGEPGTQLTMRTFHVGGTAPGLQAAAVKAKNDGDGAYTTSAPSRRSTAITSCSTRTAPSASTPRTAANSSATPSSSAPSSPSPTAAR